MISVPHAVQADPDSGRQVAAVAAAPDPRSDHRAGRDSQPPALAAPRTKRVDHARHHVVQAGDDLWSLAERYYGDGRDWRKIAAANPHVLTGGPDRLQVGWRLRIPDLDKDADAGDRVITVRRGDTLSSIAERELGTSARWNDIFHVNRAQLSDPDELAVGNASGGARAERSPRPRPSRNPMISKRRTEGSLPEHEHRCDITSPAIPHRANLPHQPSRRHPQSTGRQRRNGDPDTGPTVDVPLVSLAGVGGLLAAGVIGGLAWRRRIQLQTRPPGRRIVHPPPATVLSRSRSGSDSGR